MVSIFASLSDGLSGCILLVLVIDTDCHQLTHRFDPLAAKVI
jgi:hypothetical protein